ncbi:MAG: hypothetical protein WC384_22060 [Prolixibacteraceae bacterium]|jgi:hypothetical protein
MTNLNLKAKLIISIFICSILNINSGNVIASKTRIYVAVLVNDTNSGKDVHSLVADPESKNPNAGDFRIKNKNVLLKTGFKVFDYTLAGVYGSVNWKKLAELDPGTASHFDEAVQENEKRADK